MTALVNNLLVPVVALACLTVLVALGRLDAAVAIPIIVGLTGVHVGANASSDAQARAAAASQTPQK